MENLKEHYPVKISARKMEFYATETIIDEIVNEIKKAGDLSGCEILHITNDTRGAGFDFELSKEKATKILSKEGYEARCYSVFLLSLAMRRIAQLSKTQRERFYEKAKEVLHIDTDSFKAIEEIAIDN